MDANTGNGLASMEGMEGWRGRRGRRGWRERLQDRGMYASRGMEKTLAVQKTEV
jgi:hypothetical protein